MSRTRSAFPVATRRCAGRCQRLLPLTSEHFHRDEQSADGRQAYCKDCKATASKEAYWLREYGVTARLAQACLSIQEHKCPLCAGDLDFRMVIHIDHDHVTDEVYGLLHGVCNTGPPKNGEGARRWAAYFADPPMRKANGGIPLVRRASGQGVAQLELL